MMCWIYNPTFIPEISHKFYNILAFYYRIVFFIVCYSIAETTYNIFTAYAIIFHNNIRFNVTKTSIPATYKYSYMFFFIF